MAVTITLTGAWKAFSEALDPAVFKARLEKNLLRAGERIGRQAQARIRRSIRAGDYAPNSPVTVILKGSSKPLVDTGALFQSITFDQPNPWTVRVGVLRKSAGEKQVNIAAVLHEGATIDVGAHPQVRAKVWAMIRERLGSAGKLKGAQKGAVISASAMIGMKPMTPGRKRALNAFFASKPKAPSSGKKVWVIPARPFLVQPLDDPSFTKFVVREWGDAVRLTFLGGKQAASGSE